MDQLIPANDKQVAGEHYKAKAIQPWDYILSNQLGYMEGNIVKYVSRWKEKGGVQDLQKAMHYLQKLIEVTEAASKRPAPDYNVKVPVGYAPNPLWPNQVGAAVPKGV